MNDTMINRLSAYLDNELSETERAAIEKEVAGSPELQGELDRLRQARDWLRDFPGRRPSSDVWSGIVERVTAAHDAEVLPAAPATPLYLRVMSGFMSAPPFTWFRSARVKRLSIGALIAVAVAGMGRQVYLETLTNDLEESNRARDLQLLEMFSVANWQVTATHLRGRNGQRFSISCPQFGRAGTVWGTGTYTDDSSICTAGVHAGLISFADGGLVTVEVRPGLREYGGSTRNDVETREYGRYSGSFVFVDEGQVVEQVPQPQVISWNTAAIDYRGQSGRRLRFECPPDGETATIWGTGTYTDDSSICTAAAHMGLITVSGGGIVTVEVSPGLSRYRSTTRRGIQSNRYGEWRGSFRLVDADALVEPAESDDVEWIDWSSSAGEMRGWKGLQVRFRCPPGGEMHTVWGTEVYTDDSSICTAGVHAGRITVAEGGIVTVEILPGQSEYVGSTRFDVRTGSFGSWEGSFRFVTR